MKPEPSSKKQGSLVLRTLLIILVVIVLAGGFFVVNRMMSQPEPMPQPTTVREKIPSPQPAPAPIEADRQQNQEETKSATADDDFSAETTGNTPKATDSAESEAQPENESADEQEATADQTRPIAAEANEKTTSPPAQTDAPELQKPGTKLAVKGDPEPDETSPGRREADSNDSGEIVRDEPVSPTESPVRTGLAIQTASFLTKAYAEKRVNELKQKGYDAFIYEAFDKSQRPWYMVRFGHFENLSEADEFLVRFNEEENAAAIVVIQK